MLNFRIIILYGCLISVGVVISACGGGTVSPSNGGGDGFSVSSHNIQENSSDVDIHSNVEITFSDSVDETSVNAYTVQLLETYGHSIIESKITYDNTNKKVTIDPYLPLTFDTEFRVIVTGKVRSSSSSPQHAVKKEWLFSTPEKPTIEAFHPSKNATDVSPRSHILIQIGHGVDWATVTEDEFALYLGSTAGNPDTELPLYVYVDVETHSVYLAPIDINEEEIDLLRNQFYTYTISQDIMLSVGGSKYPSGESVTFQTSNTTAYSNTIASSWDDYSYAIDALPGDNIVVAGEAWGVVEDDYNGEFPVVEHYDGDMYLAALDSEGEVLDVMQFGSGNATNDSLEIADAAYDMVTIGNNVFVTGYTDGNLLSSDLSPSNTRSMFVAMFTWDSINSSFSSTPVWIDTQSAVSGSLLEGYAMAADASNSAIYIAARTDGSISGGTNTGEFDVAVFKYNVNSSGASLAWSKQFGTKAGDHVEGIAVANNMVYVAGSTLGDFADINNPHVGMNPFLLQLDVATGDRTATNFSFTQNPASAFDRTAIGVAVYNDKVFVAGSQRNSVGGSAFLTSFDTTSGVNQDYVQYGDTTSEDEKATSVYINGSGVVYLAITRFHKINSIDTHGLGKVLQLSGASLVDNSWDVNAGINANIRAIYEDFMGNMYATGFVYGHVDGVMPLGQGDAFVVKPKL